MNHSDLTECIMQVKSVKMSTSQRIKANGEMGSEMRRASL